MCFPRSLCKNIFISILLVFKEKITYIYNLAHTVYLMTFLAFTRVSIKYFVYCDQILNDITMTP